MPQSIGAITLLVADYDDAIAFYRDSLGFALIEDTALGNGKRWVLMAPSPTSEARLLLAKAANPNQSAQIGQQAGGRVFLFLHTTDFAADYARMKAKGVSFLEAPRIESYGAVAVFEDLHGNKWDLLEKQ
jgi:catechol 2,3-dioxygenase-like lactoylglutathione lyase family enzyme